LSLLPPKQQSLTSGILRRNIDKKNDKTLLWGMQKDQFLSKKRIAIPGRVVGKRAPVKKPRFCIPKMIGFPGVPGTLHWEKGHFALPRTLQKNITEL
jgi:hypothetical protein